jgi:thymidylate kinase
MNILKKTSKFILIEGMDRCGKTTQMKNLLRLILSSIEINHYKKFYYNL